MASINLHEAEKWERKELERARTIRIACGLWHNFPFWSGKLTFWRVFFWLVQFVVVVILALYPLWIKVIFDKTSTLTWEQAEIISGVVIVCLLVTNTYTRIWKDHKPRKTKRRLQNKLSLELKGMIAALSRAIKLHRQEHAHIVDKCKAQILQVIRKVAEIHLGDYEGTHLEVTLLLFEEDGKKIRIAERTTAERLVDKTMESENVMAYYVARSGQHRVVNDFQKDNHPFPRTSLSTGLSPTYRSMLLIPLLDTSSGTVHSIGVVSIDSSKPYHFWPGRGNDLALKVSPYCTWLTLLLGLTDNLSKIECRS